MHYKVGTICPKKNYNRTFRCLNESDGYENVTLYFAEFKLLNFCKECQESNSILPAQLRMNASCGREMNLLVFVRYVNAVHSFDLGAIDLMLLSNVLVFLVHINNIYFGVDGCRASKFIMIK